MDYGKIPQKCKPLLVLLGVIQWTLTIMSLVHVLTHKTYRFGNRPLWIILSFVSFIGPALYFSIGRGK